jgi:hypothetical protein
MFPDDNFNFLRPMVHTHNTYVTYGRGMCGVSVGDNRSKVKVTVTINRFMCYVFVSGR